MPRPPLRGELARDALGADARVGLVERHDVDLDILAEHLARRAIGSEPVQHGERVRGMAERIHWMT